MQKPSSRSVENCPDKASARTNYVYFNPSDTLSRHTFVQISNFVYKTGSHASVPEGGVGLSSVQRKGLQVSVKDSVDILSYNATTNLPQAALIYAEIAHAIDKVRPVELQAGDIVDKIIKDFKQQIVAPAQQIVFEYLGSNYKLVIGTVRSAELADGKGQDVLRGWLHDKTAFIFSNTNSSSVKLLGAKGFATTQLFKTKQVNFESLGIGGLDAQFEAIFRRAFASRVFPPSVVQLLGINHVKGMLLYGPPGTGKTLIARQIGKMLNGKEPKVVNGPEVLNKFVGQSEENIRNLFADADAEYKEKGDASELHIIIFDEIDAICKARGSSRDSTGVGDSVVNQLLTKIDGVDALNNILLIGMTNRKDMLDEALLRPGRLEVLIEISLPDEKGRHQILKIHTKKMSSGSFLGRDVDLLHLAAVTKNYSGAEIEGLVRAATSFALNRNVDFNDLHKPVDADNIKVTMDDFNHALLEIKPAFGVNAEQLDEYAKYGMINYGSSYNHLLQKLKFLVQQVQGSSKTSVLSCLLEGPPGSGKSALAATLAKESGFPFIKVVSPVLLQGYNEQAKSSMITKVFEDAYRSPLSVVILDDIERLLEYVTIGPRFSNIVLQTLLMLVKRPPRMAARYSLSAPPAWKR
jgi:vesicle-fusing ATPase